MEINYFSDIESGPSPRTKEEIGKNLWGGIVALVSSRIEDGSFGFRFPDACPDGNGVCGCDYKKFRDILRAEISRLDWPPAREEYGQDYQLPPTLVILDFIQFCYASVGLPIQGSYHSFYRHHHLTFDAEAGRIQFRSEINRLFARNAIAFKF